MQHDYRNLSLFMCDSSKDFFSEEKVKIKKFEFFFFPITCNSLSNNKQL